MTPSPLLLPRREVLRLLPGFTPDLVADYRRDGDLRVFLPNPATAFGYYFAVDVARIAGRPLDCAWVGQLPEELAPEDFATRSGLCPWALYLALRHGTLPHRRTAHGLRVLSRGLYPFTLAIVRCACPL